MPKPVLGLVAVALALSVAGCGGGDDDGASTSDETTTSAAGATTTAAGTATTAADDGAELPQFIGDFKRVCTTQVGFPGAASYEAGPGVHPMVFFDDFRGEGFIASSRTFPQGWAVQEDANFDDNSELAMAQLVVCSDRVKETPNGTQCDFESDGQKVKLELVDAVYDVKIYAASTGKELKTTTLEAKGTECPFFAAFQKGDTTFVLQPSDDDYTNAVKPLVVP